MHAETHHSSGTPSPICDLCANQLDFNLTVGSRRLYRGVVCRSCGKIECSNCKGTPIDAPCRWCGREVAPAYDVYLGGVATEVPRRETVVLGTIEAAPGEVFVVSRGVKTADRGVGDLYLSSKCIWFIIRPEKDLWLSQLSEWGMPLIERVARHEGSVAVERALVSDETMDSSGYSFELMGSTFRFTDFKKRAARRMQQALSHAQVFDREAYVNEGLDIALPAPMTIIDSVLRDSCGGSFSADTLERMAKDDRYMDRVWLIASNLPGSEDDTEHQDAHFCKALYRAFPQVFGARIRAHLRSDFWLNVGTLVVLAVSCVVLFWVAVVVLSEADRGFMEAVRFVCGAGSVLFGMSVLYMAARMFKPLLLWRELKEARGR